MESITQDLAEFIEQRVKEALVSKDEKLKKLEQDKAKLVRIASELKNEIKNMKITVSMFEKQMSNPARNNKRLEHKCVGCDFRKNPPPTLPFSHSNSSTSKLITSEPSTSKAEKLTLVSLLKQEDTNSSQRKNMNNGEASCIKVNGDLNNWIQRAKKPLTTSSLETPPPKITTSILPESATLVNSELQSLLRAPLPSSSVQVSRLTPTVKRQKSEESRNENLNEKTKSNGGDIKKELDHDDADVEIIDLSDEEDKVNDEKLLSPTRIPANSEIPFPPTVSHAINANAHDADKDTVIFTITADKRSIMKGIAETKHYEVHIYCRSETYGAERPLRHLGTVAPKPGQNPLCPVFFTASQLAREFEYHFKVRAVDEFDRYSEFSDACIFSL